jgi:hypothetical protein
MRVFMYADVRIYVSVTDECQTLKGDDGVSRRLSSGKVRTVVTTQCDNVCFSARCISADGDETVHLYWHVLTLKSDGDVDTLASR